MGTVSLNRLDEPTGFAGDDGDLTTGGRDLIARAAGIVEEQRSILEAICAISRRMVAFNATPHPDVKHDQRVDRGIS